MLTTQKTRTLAAVAIKDKTQIIKKRIYFRNIEDVIRKRKMLESSSSKGAPVSKKVPGKYSNASDYDDNSSDDSGEEEEKKVPETDFREYTAPEGCHMEPFYRPKERITMFIAGPQNCGKSYFIAEFLDEYKQFHPKRPIYLLTGLDEGDKHFARHNIRKIDMDAETIGSLSLEELRNDDKTGKRLGCLLIFDDTDRIPSKPLMKKVYDLMGMALSTGRDHTTQNGDADIDVIITNHEINDFLRTKPVLTECNYLVMFPQCSLKKQMDYCLDKVGITKRMKEMITTYNLSRSLVIHKTYPFYAVMLDRIIMLK